MTWVEQSRKYQRVRVEGKRRQKGGMRNLVSLNITILYPTVIIEGQKKKKKKKCLTRVYRLVRNTIKSAPQPLKCQRDKGWLSPS